MTISTGTSQGLGLDPAILAGGAAATAILDSMRQVQDDPADRLAAQIFEAPDAAVVAEQIRTLIQQRQFYTKDGQPSPQLPQAVQDYLRATSALPPWADPRKIKTGEDLFILYGLSSTIVLSCASLPECYVMRMGVRVLTDTGYLTTDTTRRVVETANMIMDVMSPGGLMPASGSGKGILSAQKVRLMHAAIRYMVSHGRTRLQWDPVAWGQPICQEDLAYTLMTFSYVGVRSMKKLGIVLTPEQEDAYIHCWNVVGYIMGVLPGLLPANVAEAKLLFDTIKARQTGPNPGGQQLMVGLVDGLLVPVLSKIFPLGGKRIPPILIRTLVGHETADQLGVAPLNAAMKFEGALIVGAWRRGARRRYFLYKFWLTRRLALWLKVRLLRRIGGIHGEFAITLANAVWAYPAVAEVADRSAAAESTAE